MVKMGAVWDRTAEFLTDNLSAVLPVALIAFYVPASIQGNFADLASGGGETLALILALVNLAFAALGLWGSLTLIAMAGAGEDRVEAGALATRRLGPALLVLSLLLGATCLLFAPLPVVLLAQGFDAGEVLSGKVEVGGALAWGLGGYCLALVAALLFAATRLAIVTPAIVVESRALSAIARSFAMTRGHMFAILGVVVLYTVVTVVAILAARLVFGSIFHLLVDGEEGMSLATVLTSITTAAVQTGFTVLPPVFSAKLFLALRAADATDGHRM